MNASDHFDYYAPGAGGLPFIEECMAIYPGYVGESLITQSILCSFRYLSGDVQERYNLTMGFHTEKRMFCRSTGTQLYETYFSFAVARCPFMTFAIKDRSATAIHAGARDKRTNMAKLSGYPYLTETFSRVRSLYSIDAFDWTEDA